MAYQDGFFGLQLRFAARAAQLRSVPLAQALLECTNFYVRFGCGRGFDVKHPVWQDYVGTLHGADDVLAATCAFYRRMPPVQAGPRVSHTEGCFSLELVQGGPARIHFLNVDEDAPLSVNRAGARRAELAALFEWLRSTGNQPTAVTGTSWLYNLPAYRSLFPPAYRDSATPVGRAWQRMPLWGQFLDRHGHVRPAPAAVFLRRLETLRSMDDADGCFPLQTLAVHATTEDCYRHFGLNAAPA